MNDGLHQQALRIDEDVPLFALDFLSRIEPVRIDRGPPHMGRLRSSSSLSALCILLGEPLEFMTVHFPLTSEAKPPSIVAALDDLPDLRKDDDNRWTWIRAEAQPRKPAKRKTPDAPTVGLTLEDGGLALGHIELTAKAVTLSVNSEARAARGRAMLEPALAALVRPSLLERQTVEQMMASQRDHAIPRGDLPISPEEERRIVHQVGLAPAPHVVGKRNASPINALRWRAIGGADWELSQS